MRAGFAHYDFHGIAVAVECQVPMVGAELHRMWGTLGLRGDVVGAGGDGRMIRGFVRNYDPADIRRLMPSHSRALDIGNDRLANFGELYLHDERFWLMDDRWGVACIDLLRGSWQCWVLPTPAIDPVQCLEMAILWPLAQVLLRRGMLLLPAASVVRGDRGALLIGNMNPAPDLSALLHAGYQILGQGWSVLTDRQGRMRILAMPGQLQEIVRLGPSKSVWQWVDLTRQRDGAQAAEATCEAVMLIRTGRRPQAKVEEISPSESGEFIRGSWPLCELHPQARRPRWPLRLARAARVFDVELSRHPEELLGVMQDVQRPAMFCDRPIPSASDAMAHLLTL